MNPKTATEKTFTKAQCLAFETFDAELSVSAGAGSGKTSVLVERFIRAVSEKKISPRRILAVTFTDKAANEVKSRLVQECVRRGLEEPRRDIENSYIGTIHSFCARILKENPIEAGMDPDFRVMGQGEARILAERVLDGLLESETDNEKTIALLSEYGEEKLRDSISDAYEQYRSSGGDDALWRISAKDPLRSKKEPFVRLLRLFEASIEQQKRALAAYDFDDLLYRAYRLLTDESAPAQSVYERLKDQFTLILVDEYQDVSPLQDVIIHRLRSSDNLFIVGDIQQSIYAFRNAEPGIFRERLLAHRGSSPSQNIVLRENFRSRPEILQFINRFFEVVFDKKDFQPLQAGKIFEATNHPAVEIHCALRGKTEDPENADTARAHEAERMANRILALSRQENYRWRDIALLMRSGGPAIYYERALAAKGIPYHVIGGRGFFERPEVVDLAGFLKLIDDPEDDIALAGVLRSPMAGISDDTLYRLCRLAKESKQEAPLWFGLQKYEKIKGLAAGDRDKLKDLRNLIESLRAQKEALGFEAVLRLACERTDYEAKWLARPEGRRRVANVRKFMQMASEFTVSGSVSAADFVRYIQHLSDNAEREPEAKLDSETRDAVTISTIHGVKGLEFGAVVIADMGARTKNSSNGPFLAKSPQGLGIKGVDPATDQEIEDEVYRDIAAEIKRRQTEESWRLLYVAMTRAKEKLILSGSVLAPGKEGEYKPGPIWMNQLLSQMNWKPGNGEAVEIEYAGVRVRAVDCDLPSADPNPTVRPPAWPVEALAGLNARLGTVFQNYDETRDRTVSDLLETANNDIFRDPMESALPDEDDPALPANEFGTAFHRVMEVLAIQRPARAVFSSPALHRILSGLPQKERQRLQKQATAFWSGPWGASIRSARRRYPELPFIYKARKGLLKGQIDLVFETAAGEWVILDYKTHAVSATRGPEAIAREYRFQLALYALVFSRLYGQRPKKGVLYFSAAGDAVEFPYQEGDLEGAERELDRAFTALDF